ncbi:exostosin family protein, partial [cf. Phormidesmis sp. LEGE 11477]|uniref:exostosin domain-containing protein n=1 Tax=cf. Phormidesmis sp. LEGE 11477 TaxID=1828680 RepID=UPI00187FB843
MPQLRQLDLRALASKAQNVGILSSREKSSYLKTIWHELKEIFNYFPIVWRSKRILFSEGYYGFDVYSLFAFRQPTGIDVHSNFLTNEALNSKMFSFDWSPQVDRKYKLNFIGNRNPSERTKINKLVKASLEENEQFKEALVWIEYGNEPDKPRGVTPQDFIYYLEESDFTLCPPGYSQVTHRVMEALIKGSIPILCENDLPLYDVELEDGVNCIAVRENSWDVAIETALRLEFEKVKKIRENILAMKNTFLSEKAFSTRLQIKT